nr:immunoglobulin heavy chain junction region [Mus musculus]NSM05522.1 immunoglobulin heavy chain junction region [Mus musculus]NSM05872.1 immunoglobulin heavy chain junction region [Mus musculus]NSM06711.1 immunoglobulin heavy chain junction region [Mus musculus]NSM08714.1 immunoglobulin heavy chain junction region [Mus musculus]
CAREGWHYAMDYW